MEKKEMTSFAWRMNISLQKLEVIFGEISSDVI
jgi:hypothetical protein